jgi:hypothetical protein
VVVAVVIVAVGTEQATRPSLRIVAIDPAAAPVLDGDLSDPAWTAAVPKSVLTMQGGDFGGGRQSLVEIRAMHDGEFAYFAFVWEDPTRSLKHLPLFKSGGQWYAAAERSPPEQELTFHEDKFAVLLSGSVFPLIGGAIHLSGQPSSRPDSAVRRGLHYTTNGTFADVWQWHASHNEPIGYIEDSHFGPRQAVQPVCHRSWSHSLPVKFPRPADFGPYARRALTTAAQPCRDRAGDGSADHRYECE